MQTKDSQISVCRRKHSAVSGWFLPLQLEEGPCTFLVLKVLASPSQGLNPLSQPDLYLASEFFHPPSQGKIPEKHLPQHHTFNKDLRFINTSVTDLCGFLTEESLIAVSLPRDSKKHPLQAKKHQNLSRSRANGEADSTSPRHLVCVSAWEKSCILKGVTEA